MLGLYARGVEVAHDHLAYGLHLTVRQQARRVVAAIHKYIHALDVCGW